MDSKIPLFVIVVALFQCFTIVLSIKTAEEEATLFQYAVDLYYFPNKPDNCVVRTLTSEDHARRYFYDYIPRCLRKSHVLGEIDRRIDSHLICVSQCEQHGECVGGLYWPSGRTCYMLKHVPCLSPDQLLMESREPKEFGSFFFYHERSCNKDISGCEVTETTTPSPQEVTEKEEEHEGEHQSVSEKVSETVKGKLAINLGAQAQGVGVGAKSRVSSMRLFVDLPSTSTSTGALFVKLPPVVMTNVDKVDSTVKQVMTFAMDDMDDSLNKLEAHLEAETKPKPEPKSIQKPYGRKRSLEQPLVLPDVPEDPIGDGKGINRGDPERESAKARRQKNLSEAFGDPTYSGQKRGSQDSGSSSSSGSGSKGESTSDLSRIGTERDSGKRKKSNELIKEKIVMADCTNLRHKRAINQAFETCKKFVKKLAKSMETMKSKINYDLGWWQTPDSFKMTMQEKIQHRFSQFTNKKEAYMMKLGGVGKVASVGLLGGTLLPDLLKGDFRRVLLNVGFFLLSYSSSWAAEKAMIQATKLLQKGKVRAAFLLKAIGPLLKTISTTYVVYSFYRSIVELNTSDPDTIMNLAANSILLGVELCELGIIVLVTVGVISVSVVASAGIAAIAITVGVFIGVRIYEAVMAVENIKQILPLTGGEIFLEGLIRFISGFGLASVKEMVDAKQANMLLRNSSIEMLKNSRTLEMVFVPTGTVNNGSELVISTRREINLREIKLVHTSRKAPDSYYNFETICLPSDNTGIKHRVDYVCTNAFGVQDRRNEAKDKRDVMFEFSADGNDTIIADDRDNFYNLGDGDKKITGGNKRDTFILFGNNTNGTLKGLEGYDTIYATHFHPTERVQFNIDHVSGNVRMSHFDFKIGERRFIEAIGIEDIWGRPKVADFITVPCYLQYLNTNGGLNRIRDRDMIFLQKHCSYNLNIVLGPNSVVMNKALKGEVNYHMANVSGTYFIHLQNEQNNQTNVFRFYYNISQVLSLKKLESNFTLIRMNDTHQLAEKNAKISIKNANHNTVLVFEQEAVIMFGEANAYLIVSSNESKESIMNEYVDTIDRLGLILRAKSLQDSCAVVAGHSNYSFNSQMDEVGNMKNVLANDHHQVTHMYPGLVKNVYMIGADDAKYNESVEKFKIPDVHIHYYEQPRFTDEIELSILASKLRRAYPKVKLHVTVGMMYGDTDIKVKLHLIKKQAPGDNSNRIEFVKTIGSIVLHNALETNAYENVIIALNSGFRFKVISDEDNEVATSFVRISLEPLPIKVNTSEHHIVLLSEDDVLPDNSIYVDKDIVDFDYFNYNNSLLITNVAKDRLKATQFFSIMLHNFYTSQTMQSTFVHFKDMVLSMKAAVDLHGVLNLPDQSAMFEKFAPKFK